MNDDANETLEKNNAASRGDDELHVSSVIPGETDESAVAAVVTGVSIDSFSPSTGARTQRIARWTKLKSVEVKNFKAIEALDLPVADVTILVGPNGCGKSSVLQAIHWAARAASYIPPKNTKEVVSFDRLDYLPSSDTLKTAHKRGLSSDTGTAPTSVAFKHIFAEGESQPVASIKIWAARNRGGISVHIEGGAAVTPFKQRREFITAYIPGLAGLSEKETILVQPVLRRQAASGDAGSVLRNVLFNLTSRQPGETDDAAALFRITRLNKLIQSVHPGAYVEVSFDDREDVNLRASFGDARLSGSKRPLEAAATGLLQVVQIFAYLILFRPKLLLVDEPDAHLHPDKQERLIEALEAAAAEFQTQVILTTHSPHIVRAASANANLVWIRDGTEVKTDDDTIRTLLGWGGLDKKCIFFVEDEDDQPIRTLLRQWPNLYRQLSICRCFGIDNLPKNKLLEGLIGEGGLVVKVLIHRDRDFMTEEESRKWSGNYKTDDTTVWITEHVDAEAYYCQPAYLASLYGVSEAESSDWINQATKNINKAYETFSSKRGVVNRVLYDSTEGGQPSTKELWQAAGGQTAGTVLGKSLLKALKPVVKSAGKDDSRLHRLEIPPSIVLAPELKSVLEQLLS
ncbi:MULTISPECIES: ATP-dependent endonuclease [Burkholderia]|uniref:Putative ATP-dependent endonuclease of OLD family n=1 Tax=Burkholderia pyrrocinia TaxID=60550 RepID=A0A318IUI1_BURPY|nr:MULTISPECIES: ATP-binding protein [Burkholderia]PXX39069.1 putative ATP-dependent endonuclease of OLD family [Burkholderia pyrrocinia]SFW15779.1 Predicted ATP-dependent endonuclease of the OLD family, contains P-loop ATPase and TOPRIM domains [Burkholderia sp. NFACC33-1]SFX07415.1 Predicted ATP-dependent endonuclease of the OLD family, contains P-loop ATPase and TOPRIM domains [Burkholderia sp. NFPP32]